MCCVAPLGFFDAQKRHCFPAEYDEVKAIGRSRFDESENPSMSKSPWTLGDVVIFSVSSARAQAPGAFNRRQGWPGLPRVNNGFDADPFMEVPRSPGFAPIGVPGFQERIWWKR